MGHFNGKQGFGGPKGGDRGGDRFRGREAGRGAFPSNRDMGKRDFSGQPDMHKATCSDCGATCEVPFRPTGEKPVYCNNCFAAHREGGAGDNRKFEKKDFGPRPHDRGPARFEHKTDTRGNDSAHVHELKRRVDELHAKLDRVLTHIGAETKPAAAQTAPKAHTPTAAPKGSGNLVPQKIKKEVAAKKSKLEKKEVKKVAKKETKKPAKAKATKKASTKKK